MFSSPGTNSCISGCNFVKDKSDTLPPCSLAAAKMISAFVDFLAVCIFSEEIGKYAQGLRDNIEKNNRKNKQ
jgi:hypothetical protein